jgi:hypothetical protein
MFVKHIGKHNNRKVAIVFRQVPDEDHMALVTYTETIPTMFHDAIMQVIESDAGQGTDDLSEVLHRNFLADGRGILEGLHKEGMLKKVPTSQVIVTPNPQSHVRLDELNKIINDLKTGNEASEKMRELDENAGMVDPNAKREQDTTQNAVVEPLASDGVLDDTAIAQNLMEQSKAMAAQAEAMVAESKRLQEEAFSLDASLKPKAPKKKSTRKKSTRKKATTKKATSNKTVVTESVKDTETEKVTED